VTDLALTRRVRLPSVDEVLRWLRAWPRRNVSGASDVAATRRTLGQLRSRGRTGAVVSVPNGAIGAEVMHRLEASDARRLRRVFNLTGTVCTPTSAARFCRRRRTSPASSTGSMSTRPQFHEGLPVTYDRTLRRGCELERIAPR
jgi:hypothetical protein